MNYSYATRPLQPKRLSRMTSDWASLTSECAVFHSLSLPFPYSSSGGISSSIYRTSVTRISVVSLPRRTSLTKWASTCIWTCMALGMTSYINMREKQGNLPSPMPLVTHHIVYSKTTIDLAHDHRPVIPQNPPADSRPEPEKIVYCRWSNW